MAARPLITANQVTFARLALIPLPCWLLYQGLTAQYWALVLATLIGCTDFVDGYLARKYGPTVLGGLMDPIADKVFTALIFLPAVDLHWLPAWMVAALFVREFFVTGARTVFERRNLTLKSSYLSRYKTWVQMCGIGILFLLHAFGPSTVAKLFVIGTALPLLGMAIFFAIKRRLWKGSAAFTVSFGGLFVVHHFAGAYMTELLLGWYILAITWGSGLGYVIHLFRLGGQPLDGKDLSRLVTSVALPIVVLLVQTHLAVSSGLLILLVSVEMAHGGFDNLLAHNHVEASASAWTLRMGAESILVGAGLLVPALATSGVALAAALAVVGLAVVAIQKRDYYLAVADRRLADARTPSQVVV